MKKKVLINKPLVDDILAEKKINLQFALAEMKIPEQTLSAYARNYSACEVPVTLLFLLARILDIPMIYIVAKQPQNTA